MRKSQVFKKKKHLMLYIKQTFHVLFSTKRNIKGAFVDPIEKTVKASCSLGVIKLDNKGLTTDCERECNVVRGISRMGYIR